MSRLFMSRSCSLMRLFALVFASGVLAGSAVQGQVPDFAAGSDVPAAAGEQVAVFAGGCFWGVDAIFKHVRGVSRVVSGYAGGGEATAQYQIVSTGAKIGRAHV